MSLDYAHGLDDRVTDTNLEVYIQQYVLLKPTSAESVLFSFYASLALCVSHVGSGTAVTSRAVRRLASWPAEVRVFTTALPTTTTFHRPSPLVTSAPLPSPTASRQASHSFTSKAATTTTNPNTNRASRPPKLPAFARNGGGPQHRAASSSAGVSGPAAKRVLYDGHQPISPLQRTAMAGWAAVTALMEPERADMVATLGEVTGRLALERLYR